MEIKKLQTRAETPPQYSHTDFKLYSPVVTVPFRTICCSIKSHCTLPTGYIYGLRVTFKTNSDYRINRLVFVMDTTLFSVRYEVRLGNNVVTVWGSPCEVGVVKHKNAKQEITRINNRFPKH
jgi:hypothetical protein